MVEVLERHIERTEGLRGGKPHLAGTRITVSDIVIWHLRLGRTLDEIAARYELSLSAVYAAIAYYYDHRDEIDSEIAACYASYEELKGEHVSRVEQKLKPTDSG